MNQHLLQAPRRLLFEWTCEAVGLFFQPLGWLRDGFVELRAKAAELGSRTLRQRVLWDSVSRVAWLLIRLPRLGAGLEVEALILTMIGGLLRNRTVRFEELSSSRALFVWLLDRNLTNYEIDLLKGLSGSREPYITQNFSESKALEHLYKLGLVWHATDPHHVRSFRIADAGKKYLGRTGRTSTNHRSRHATPQP